MLLGTVFNGVIVPLSVSPFLVLRLVHSLELEFTMQWWWPTFLLGFLAWSDYTHAAVDTSKVRKIPVSLYESSNGSSVIGESSWLTLCSFDHIVYPQLVGFSDQCINPQETGRNPQILKSH